MKVRSFTDPAANALEYQPWYLRKGHKWFCAEVIDGQARDKLVVVQVSGITEREDALAWVGAEVVIDRNQLPKPEPGEYYWTDLVGLTVVTADGTELGVVERLMETGANDVLVVRGDRERLIPFVTPDVVKDVDLASGRLTVDWDPDF